LANPENDPFENVFKYHLKVEEELLPSKQGGSAHVFGFGGDVEQKIGELVKVMT
jgi:hypothetical protein